MRKSNGRNNKSNGAIQRYPNDKIPQTLRGFGFPNKMQATLRYHATLLLTSTVGSVGQNAFRWNSTFDPDITGTGHQPLFRDTFAAVYDHYSVVSAKATVKFMNTLSSVPIICGIITDDDSSVSSTIDTLCEQKTGQHRILPPVSGALSTHTFIATWDCKDVLGIDPYASETYKTAVGSNPAEESDLIVWFSTLDASTNSNYVDIELEQLVLFTELATPTQS